MKKKILGIIILIHSAFFTALFAESIKEKYMSTYEKIEKAASSQDEKLKLLKENINRALKMTLLEQYNLCNYQNAQINADSFEVSDLNPNLVYIKYGNFVGYYLFSADPTKFLQAPLNSNLLLEPGSKIIKSYDKNCIPGAKTSPIASPVEG
jgi:hypothetical protein